jgi:HEAT repeat protein
MRKRIYLSLTVLLLALILMIGWRVLSQKEPTYQGRRESAWLSQYAPNTDPSDVDDALRAMGTNAIPLLLDYLRSEDSLFRILLTRIGLSYVAAEVRHQQAEKGFAALAEMASNAVPDLAKIYERNDSPSARQAAANALVEIGPASRPALPIIMASATNSDPDVRGFALYTLGRLALDPARVCPILTNAIRDSNREVRVQAAFGISVLSFMGGDARPAIPALIPALQDSYPPVRCGAAEALGHIHSAPELVVPALSALLRDSNGSARGSAASALGAFGTNAKSSLSALNELLTDSDSDARKAASNSLSRINFDPSAAPATK